MNIKERKTGFVSMDRGSRRGFGLVLHFKKSKVEKLKSLRQPASADFKFSHLLIVQVEECGLHKCTHTG